MKVDFDGKKKILKEKFSIGECIIKANKRVSGTLRLSICDTAILNVDFSFDLDLMNFDKFER